MHLTEPVKAAREMARVTRKGGTVAAFERGSIYSTLIPGDESLTKLALRLG
jgi:ubiquinone/menaquinone biosynthesis C-methylase UbiE